MATTRRERRLQTLSYSLTTQLDEYDQFSVKCSPLFRRELRKMLNSIERTARRIVDREHRRYSNKNGKGKRLMRSIHAQPIRDLPGGRRISGTVTAGSRLAPYARYVHEGTEPHEITPKKANALSFEWKYRRGRVVVMNKEEITRRQAGRDQNAENGKYYRMKARWGVGPIADRSVVVEYVNHPGQDGNPFLNRAAAVMIAKYGGRVDIPQNRRRRAYYTRGL